MDHPGGRHRLKIALSLLFIVSLLAPAARGDSGPLPARDWNPQNLKRLVALPPNPLTFAVLGDSRNNPQVFQGLLRQMARDPDIQFVIHLGDMVDEGDLTRYRGFFQSLRPYLKMPLLAVIGNHELQGDPGGKLYAEIYGPRYFSFQLQGNYFIMLDDADKTGLDEKQLNWLTAELQKAQAYQTRLVFLHVPLFDPRGGEHHHCLPPESGRRLAALFQEYKVTRIFAAHIHSYFDGAWDGVPFAITAGAGAKLYGNDPRHFFHHYLKVSIKGDRVQIQVRPLGQQGGQ
ncbi:MAG: metallophosphoesterase [Pseudomonadota bacterium]